MITFSGCWTEGTRSAKTRLLPLFESEVNQPDTREIRYPIRSDTSIAFPTVVLARAVIGVGDATG
jgi:hypothetical protein